MISREAVFWTLVFPNWPLWLTVSSRLSSQLGVAYAVAMASQLALQDALLVWTSSCSFSSWGPWICCLQASFFSFTGCGTVMVFLSLVAHEFEEGKNEVTGFNPRCVYL